MAANGNPNRYIAKYSDVAEMRDGLKGKELAADRFTITHCIDYVRPGSLETWVVIRGDRILRNGPRAPMDGALYVKLPQLSSVMEILLVEHGVPCSIEWCGDTFTLYQDGWLELPNGLTKKYVHDDNMAIKFQKTQYKARTRYALMYFMADGTFDNWINSCMMELWGYEPTNKECMKRQRVSMKAR